MLGIELLPSLHAIAQEKLDAARGLQELELRTPHVSVAEGSWESATALPWSDIDVAFAYTTAFPHDRGVLRALTNALEPRLRRGCVVCTTDYRLAPSSFELLDEMEGENDGVGGVSVAYIHRKITDGDARTQGDLLKAQVEELKEALAERDESMESLRTRLAECERLRRRAEDRTSNTGGEEVAGGIRICSEDEFLEALRRGSLETGYLTSSGELDYDDEDDPPGPDSE